MKIKFKQIHNIFIFFVVNKKQFEFYWKIFLYLRCYFGLFESIFGIFSFLFFGNSPLFPAKQQRKSTQNTSQIIPK